MKRIANKKGFNTYRFDGDIGYFDIVNRKGELFTVTVDADILERLIEFNQTWHVWWNKNSQSYYVRAIIYLESNNGKSIEDTVYLQRWITNTIHTLQYVDHKNHDTLDNRRQNLRVSGVPDNSSNRKGANKNSGTGHRNVNWGYNHTEYFVQFCRKGERFKWVFPLSLFKEACDFADKKRIEIFGEFAGKG